MKKFLFLIALFTLMGGVNSYATKLYATYGTPAANGSWDSGTSTYTWTDGSNNLMDWFTFSNGELANYKSLKFSTSNYTNTYRVCFMIGGNAVATITFYSAGEKNLVFSERNEIKNLDLSTITSIKFGGAAGTTKENPLTITVSSKPYLEKPMSLILNDNSEAEIDLTDLTASNNFSFNDQTGELTKTGNGELNINFPSGGVDLTNLTGFSVTYTGTNLFGGFKIGTSEKTKDFYSNPTGRDDLNQYMTVADVGNPSAITRWQWWQNGETGTMTISSIKLKFKGGVIKAARSKGETAIESLERKYYEDEEWKTGTVNYSYGNSKETVIGDGNATQDEYIDLSGYNELRMYVSSGDIRVFAVKADGFTPSADGYIITKDGVKQNGQWNGIQDKEHKLVKNGDYYYITIDDLKAACGGQAKLIGVKAEYGQTVDISKVVVVSEYDYAISGTGPLSISTTNALADASATSYNSTEVTGTGVDFTSVANKNALFKANSGVLSNTNNVIVDGAASLVLTDGNYPFSAPETFTATSVSFNRTFKAGTRSTVCLPFALTAAEAAEAGTFYELSGTENEGTQLTFTDITASGTTAYKPYIFEANADGAPFTGYSSKEIAETPATFTGTTVEGYTLTGVLTGSTDVAADHAGKKVYGWSGNSGEEEGKFVKVGSGVSIDPFRAYVVYNGSGNNARLAARFVGGSVTGISEVSEAQNVLNPDGKYIENGKIVIVKNGVKYNAAGQQVK